MQRNPRGRKNERIYRRRRIVAATVLAIVFVALLIGTALGAAHLTSGSGTCQRCHEMRPYYQSWQQSAHRSVECAQCHIPSGTVGLVRAKIGALREVYVHFAGDGDHAAAGQLGRPADDVSVVPPQAGGCRPTPPPRSPTAAHTSGACSDCHRGLFHPTAPPAKPIPAVAKLGTMDNCLTCHDGTTAPKTCSTCHTPPHKTSGECSVCHTPKSWKQPVALSASVPEEACLTCHPKPKDVTLKNSTFSHAAHKAEACVDCHDKQLHPGKKGSAKVSMASCLTCHDGTTAPKKCSTCHTAPHPAFGECGLCHTAKNWTPVSAAEAAKRGFDHPLALNGRHATLKCASCHETFGAPPRRLRPSLRSAWAATAIKHKGLTDCTRCHKTSGWTPANFAHPGVSGMNWRGMACGDCHPRRVRHPYVHQVPREQRARRLRRPDGSAARDSVLTSCCLGVTLRP